MGGHPLGEGSLVPDRGRGNSGRQVLEIAVAVRALQRRVLVYHNLLALNDLDLFVTLVAGYVGMPTGERQVSLIMVEG